MSQNDDNGSIWKGSEQTTAYVVLLLVSTILGSIGSITILILIRKMGLKNGHILLISTMSWFQLMYDISFFMGLILALFTV